MLHLMIDDSSSSSSSSGSIVVTKEPIDPVYAKAHGLESVVTIQIEEDTDSKGNKYGGAANCKFPPFFLLNIGTFVNRFFLAIII